MHHATGASRSRRRASRVTTRDSNTIQMSTTYAVHHHLLSNHAEHGRTGFPLLNTSSGSSTPVEVSLLIPFTTAPGRWIPNDRPDIPQCASSMRLETWRPSTTPTTTPPRWVSPLIPPRGCPTAVSRLHSQQSPQSKRDIAMPSLIGVGETRPGATPRLWKSGPCQLSLLGLDLGSTARLIHMRAPASPFRACRRLG